jgi:cytidylate kinase
LPIITISRESLSGGRAVAECLARTLDYPLVGREVLQEAAEKLGLAPDDLQGRFETTPGLWARLTKERERYFLAVQSALAEWCTRGNLVYHGVAGQFLLKDLPGVLRVLIVAPMETRVHNLLETHSRLTRDQVLDFIRKVDQERSRWVRVMYGADVQDPSLYDLTVNLRKMSMASACRIIAEAATQPRFEISDEVEAELFSFAAGCRRRLSQLKGG